MKRFLGSLLVLMVLTFFSSCELLETTGTVTVQNLTSSTIIADVNDGNGDWRGEKTIYAGNSATYTGCEIGDIDGAARFSGYNKWYYSSTYTLSAGGTVTITWYPTKKSAEVDNVNSGLGEMVGGIVVESGTVGDK